MKAHEETWIVPAGCPDVVARVNDDGMQDHILFGDNHRLHDFAKDSPARARLAAQAPAMARLLLFRMGDRHCEYCGVKVDRVTDTDIVDPVYKGETLSLSDPSHHGKGCGLVAVLTAAGVL